MKLLVSNEILVNESTYRPPKPVFIDPRWLSSSNSANIRRPAPGGDRCRIPSVVGRSPIGGYHSLFWTPGRRLCQPGTHQGDADCAGRAVDGTGIAPPASASFSKGVDQRGARHPPSNDHRQVLLGCL